MERNRIVDFLLVLLGALALAPFVYACFFSVHLLVFMAGWALIAASSWVASRFVSRERRGLAVFAAHASYVILFWSVVFTCAGVERRIDMEATWRADGAGRARRLVFDYVGHLGCYEAVRSAELERKLAGRNGERVRLTLVLTYDFGKLRSYHVEAVDGVRVQGLSGGEGWSGGSAPWSALRSARP